MQKWANPELDVHLAWEADLASPGSHETVSRGPLSHLSTGWAEGVGGVGSGQAAGSLCRAQPLRSSVAL